MVNTKDINRNILEANKCSTGILLTYLKIYMYGGENVFTFLSSVISFSFNKALLPHLVLMLV